MEIHEAAALSGLSADTIRFYERKRVLPRPPRRENGYREYTAEHVATLRLAKGLRELEMPLDEVKAILALAHDGTCKDLREALRRTVADALDQIDAHLRELQHTRHQLAAIAAGLRSMRPTATRVPGMTSCACVRLVTSRRALP